MDTIGAAGVAVIGFGALYIIWLGMTVGELLAKKDRS